MRVVSLSMSVCFALFVQSFNGENIHAETIDKGSFPAKLKSMVTMQDSDNDGHPDSVHSFRGGFDETGRMSESIFECDHDFNGIPENRELNFYNEAGQLKQKYHFFDGNGDFLLDSQQMVKIRYDAHGRMAEKTIRIDHGEDGTVDETIAYSYFHAPDGRVLEKTKFQVSSGVVSGFTERYAYEQSADGRIDGYTVIKSDPAIETGENIRYEFAYGAGGRVLEKIVRTDSDDDGRPDIITTTKYSYLNAGSLNTVTTDIDVDADGDADLRYTNEVVYDAHNRPSRLERRGVYLGGDIFIFSETRNFKYNGDNTGCEISTVVDGDGDGLVDSTLVRRIAFAEEGMMNRTFMLEIGQNVEVAYPLLLAVDEKGFHSDHPRGR